MDESDLTFSNLKNVLQNPLTAQGDSIEAHLQKVFKQLIIHYPTDALERIEEVSYLIKQGHDLNDYLKLQDDRTYRQVSLNQSNYTSTASKHFPKQAVNAGGEEGEEPEQAAPVGFVQDLMAERRIYQWAGIGLGEQETYRLQKSMKKLSTDKGASQLRFFGKIHGSQSDYYVVEAVVDGGEEGAEEGAGEAPADQEAKGSGVNKFTYFVAKDSLSEWTALPDLTPSDISAARQIKILFTGDLNRNIYSNPFFFGQEKHYLRAQISRIVHSTTLLPKGLWRTVEDDDRNIEENTPEDGELEIPSTKAMGDIEMWVHANPNILKNCRTGHMEPEDDGSNPDFDPEEAKKVLEAADPYEGRLKPISKDDSVSVSAKK
jgi:radial spoke head protein 4/6